VGSVPLWLARLKGHEFDLKELSEHFRSPERSVRKDEDGHYYLRSAHFDSSSDAAAVRKQATEMIGHMNGAVKLHAVGSYHMVDVVHVACVDEGGGCEIFVSAADSIGARDSISVNLPAKEGDVVELSRRPSEIERLAALAERDERVAAALRFFQRGDWVSLYKVWEIVRDGAGGEHQLLKSGWTTKTTKDRFTRTAQSPKVLGDEARHASEHSPPPSDPMSPDEAKAFVKSLMEAWVRTL
jgi:hypothetical protein